MTTHASRIGALLAVALVASCSDSTTDVSFGHPGPGSLGELEILGATPYHTVDGKRVPACSANDDPEGFLLRFNITSTAHKGALMGNQDFQLREGEEVGGQTLTVGPGGAINPEMFGVELTCIEGYPDTTADCEPDDGLKSPSAMVRDVGFTARSSSRAEPIAVAILVDHSASMIGFGNPDYKEVRDGSPLSGAQSDPTHSRYRAAVEGIVKKLKDDDRLIAWTFNEAGIRLACNAPGIELVAEPGERERACFSTQHAWVGGDISVSDPTQQLEGAFTELATGAIVAEGRTPLWAAVDHAWTFMHANAKSATGEPMPRHIVVITDSPDTCDPESTHYLPDEPCSSHVPFSEVAKKVQAVPFEQRIPISFVQFQSYGYPQQDPAQMEIACLTGGTYKWINRLSYADDSTELEETVKSALDRIRYTFGGVWHVFVEVPSLSEAGAGGKALLPAGRIFALDGSMTLVPPNIIAPQEVSYPFRLSAPRDTRLLLRRPCATETDCPGGQDGDCVVSCIPEGSVCAWPDADETSGGVPVGEGGTCDPGDGTEGTCCCGTCQTASATCTVNQSPCCDPTVDGLFCL